MFQLDTTKYEARLTTEATEYWPKLGGIAETTGQYTLDSTGLVDSTGQSGTNSTGLVDSTGECGTSILEVNFMFWDEELVMCSFYEVSQGPPLYSKQPVTDLSDAASGFLQRYQTHTGDAQLAQMRSVLDTVEVTSNMTKTVDNLSLEVYVEDDKTFFAWGNTESARQCPAYNQLVACRAPRCTFAVCAYTSRLLRGGCTNCVPAVNVPLWRAHVPEGANAPLRFVEPSF